MEISVNCNSSIRIASDKVIYFDPFRIENETHDADIIFITHDHFDHFSPEDIKKAAKMAPAELEGKVLLGEFSRVEGRPEYVEEYDKIIHIAGGDR